MRGSTAFPIVCTLLLTLSVASSALADTALFRVEQRWHQFPAPPVTTPGGAGMYQGYIQPYYLDTPWGKYLNPPATAIVEPGNPVGGAFTLPTGFLDVTSTFSFTPKTAWPGYTTVVYVDYYNGPGKFQPNFRSAASNLPAAGWPKPSTARPSSALSRSPPAKQPKPARSWKTPTARSTLPWSTSSRSFSIDWGSTSGR